MSDDVRETKKAWRRLAVDLFALLPRDCRRALDAALSERAAALGLDPAGTVLLGFAPMSDEPDLSVFYRRWQCGGGALALPVWLGGDRMIVRKVADLDSELRAGRGGIMEPLDTLPEVDPRELRVVIAPGRVFSETRERMGRGSGCYDALLRDNPCLKIGVAYDFQVFPSIPVEEKDVRLDAVLTPTRLIGELPT